MFFKKQCTFGLGWQYKYYNKIMMKRLLHSLTLLIVIGTITGCDNYDLLLSEKKLNSNIQRTWKYVLPKHDDGSIIETWTFQDDKISLHVKSSSVDTTYLGKYSVDARFSKAYVNLSGFTFVGNTLNSGFSATDLNRRWNLVELNNPVFYLSSTNDRGTLQSLEYIEQ